MGEQEGVQRMEWKKGRWVRKRIRNDEEECQIFVHHHIRLRILPAPREHLIIDPYHKHEWAEPFRSSFTS